jgi:hypothetical protein
VRESFERSRWNVQAEHFPDTRSSGFGCLSNTKSFRWTGWQLRLRRAAVRAGAPDVHEMDRPGTGVRRSRTDEANHQQASAEHAPPSSSIAPRPPRWHRRATLAHRPLGAEAQATRLRDEEGQGSAGAQLQPAMDAARLDA